MDAIRPACLLLCCSVSCALTSSAQSAASVSLPDTVLSQLQNGSRFKDASYAGLMLGADIKKVSSKIIFERMTAAAALKENYKALYLARLFTESEPSLQAGWSNRAALAAALGLKEEASACQKKAYQPAAIVSITLETLPGRVSVRPLSLADWAAAMELLADAVSAKFGNDSLLAVRDDVSGIQVPSSEEVKQNDEELVELGLPPDGPWSAPAPINLNQVAPNIFLLDKPEAMHYKTVKKGSMFGAMMMAGLSGMTAATNPVGSAETSEMAGQMASNATNVANHYVGGKYIKVAFPQDLSQPTSIADHPIPAGKSHAVGNPMPILWASGSSTQPTFWGHWSAGTKPLVAEHRPGKKEDPKHRVKMENVADLQYPRLGVLCSGSCSEPVSAFELMLTREDVAAMSPNSAYLVPSDLDQYRQAYIQNNLTLVPTNFKERWFLGFDANGDAFEVNSTPAGWLVPAK